MKRPRYTVQVRVSEQERSRFERAALDQGLTLSEWARLALRGAAGMWTGGEKTMSKSTTIEISAAKYENDNDSLKAAAEEYADDHPRARGYDLNPRWANGERTAILLDVPIECRASDLCDEYLAEYEPLEGNDLRTIVDEELRSGRRPTVQDIRMIVFHARKDFAQESAER
jgi:hypothetical protein